MRLPAQARSKFYTLDALVHLALVSPGLAISAYKIKKEKKTFLTYIKLYSLVSNFMRVKRRKKGRIHAAEFGVGRGGSALLLAQLIHRKGDILSLFDLFGRIPPPIEKDGVSAQQRYEEIVSSENTSGYYGNITSLQKLIQQEISQVCSLENVRFIAGRYGETLPKLDTFPHLDFVHIDCDWYESTKSVLQFLSTHLNPGAILQIDDYSTWEGSRLAVDEADWLGPFQKHFAGDALVIDTFHMQ